MASIEPVKRARRTRRHFTDEFKAGAVRLLLDEGTMVARVAGDLDLTGLGGAGLGRARADRTKSRG